MNTRSHLFSWLPFELILMVLDQLKHEHAISFAIALMGDFDFSENEKWKFNKITPTCQLLFSACRDLYRREETKLMKIVSMPFASYALMHDGRCYMWGAEEYCVIDKPKLVDFGVNSPTAIFPGKAGIVFSENNKFYKRVGRGPHQNILFPNAENEEIALLYEYERVTFALTKRGKVYAAGLNFYNNLGLNDQAFGSFELVEALSEKHIIKVASSGSHTIFLSKEGEVFSVGSNHFGQLGLNSQLYLHRTPQKVTALSKTKVIDIAVGEAHSLFLTSDTVYSCGCNANGALGIGSKEYQLVPVNIEALSKHRIKEIAAGAYHSLFLTWDGEVHSTGNGHKGQLGLGKVDQVSVPTKITALAGKTIWHMVSAGNRSLCISENNELFEWGAFLLHNKIQSTPTRVDFIEPLLRQEERESKRLCLR